MVRTEVLILGGGLAGLSTAYHLRRLGGPSCLVVEKAASPGGTAGSIEHEGFLFDHTGHLLHLHDPYGLSLATELVEGGLGVHERSSWIHSSGAWTRYPFQANTFGLPEAAVDECLVGFFKTVHRPGRSPRGPSFRDWSLRLFGEGISRRFMFPYNEKLWRRPLSELTTEWQGRFVPKPSPAEVLYGGLRDQRGRFGYNATFRYPKRGGSQALADGLAARLEPGTLRLSCPAASVDLEERVAVVPGVGEVAYERLVSTLPLPELLRLCVRLPRAVREAGSRLRWNTVLCLNLGVDRPLMPGRHWAYFPERRFPFYRVGCYSNFSRTNHPSGTGSLYVEVSRRPGERADLPRLERACLEGLRACGILRRGDRLLARLWTPIPCAYVVYDFERTPAVRAVMAHLSRLGAESIGRYGAWKYSFMEETILDGRACAARLAGKAEGRSSSTGELKPLR